MASIFNFQGVDLGGGIGFLSGLFVTLIILAVVVFLVWFLYKFLRYNIKVVVLEKVGETFRVRYDRGGVFNKKGFIDFKLWSSRKDTINPKYEDLLPNLKKGNTLFLVKYGEGDYTSLHFDEELLPAAPFKPVETNAANWLVLRMQRNKQQYGTETFWSKYKEIIVPLTAFMFAFLVIFFVLRQMDTVSQSFTSAAASISDGLRELARPTVPAAP